MQKFSAKVQVLGITAAHFRTTVAHLPRTNTQTSSFMLDEISGHKDEGDIFRPNDSHFLVNLRLKSKARIASCSQEL
jgi:hypothetical protein